MKLLHETRSGSSECGSVSVNHIKVQSIKLLVPTKTFELCRTKAIESAPETAKQIFEIIQRLISSFELELWGDETEYCVWRSPLELQSSLLAQMPLI